MREIEATRRDAIKEFAYGASHELNNPLANIAARAQLLLQGESRPAVRRHLVEIHSQALRASEMLSDLMVYANPPSLARSSFAIEAWLEDISRSAAVLVGSAAHSLRFTVENRVRGGALHADRVPLTVAVLELVKNAIEAAEAAGTVQIVVDDDRPDGQPNEAPEGLAGISIRVIDDGPGVVEASREKIFDPFFSGRDAGRGIGFGLCKAWRIAQQHGGTLELARSEPGHTEFLLRLPQ